MNGEATESRGYRVLFTGDVDFGESYANTKLEDCPSAHFWKRRWRRTRRLRELLDSEGHAASLRELQKLLDESDLVIGNLEVPLAMKPDARLVHDKQYLGWTDPARTARVLREAGFDAFSLANNHSLDCGEGGLRSTLEHLQAQGLSAFGAGDDAGAAGRPFIRRFQAGGEERTLVVFGAFEHRDLYQDRFRWYATEDRTGVNPIDAARVADQVASLRHSVPAPFFVAYPHWGVDYKGVCKYQRAYAKDLVAAGVDLIVGHGAHVYQDVEYLDEKLVMFGLGNFAFNSPGRFLARGAPPVGLASMLCFGGTAPERVSVRIYPLFVDNEVTGYRSRPVDEALFQDTLERCTSEWRACHFDGTHVGCDDFGHYFEIPSIALDKAPESDVSQGVALAGEQAAVV